MSIKWHCFRCGYHFWGGLVAPKRCPKCGREMQAVVTLASQRDPEGKEKKCYK